MKTFPPFTTCLCVALLSASPVYAAKHHKSHSAPQPSALPLPSASTAAQPPSVQLSVLFQNSLDKVVAPLDQKVVMPRTEVALLRTNFAQKLALAEQGQKAPYQAGIAVCDAFTQAMDEREKAQQNYQQAQAVHGPGDVADVRKSAPKRGRGSGSAAIAEARKEGQEENRDTQGANQKDAFLNAGLLKS